MKGKTKVKKAKKVAKKAAKKVVKDTSTTVKTKKGNKVVDIKAVIARYKDKLTTGTMGGKRIKFVIPTDKISLPERKSLTAYLHGKVGIGKEGVATFKVNSEFRIFVQKDKIELYEKAIGHKVTVIEKKKKETKKEPDKKAKKIVKADKDKKVKHSKKKAKHSKKEAKKVVKKHHK